MTNEKAVTENKKTVTEKQLVVFDLNGESYGVDISVVREIIHLQSITRVPGTPVAVEGVINLRGSVIPVVDLRSCFQLEAQQRDKKTRIVVVNGRGQDIGVIVDSVAEVLRVPMDSIEPPSAVITGGNAGYLLGIVKLSSRLVILLDVNQVLCGQDLSVLGTTDQTKNKSESIAQNEKIQVNSKEAVLV
jgi:purine-binding chemotaxis protein CheW